LNPYSFQLPKALCRGGLCTVQVVIVSNQAAFFVLYEDRWLPKPQWYAFTCLKHNVPRAYGCTACRNQHASSTIIGARADGTCYSHAPYIDKYIWTQKLNRTQIPPMNYIHNQYQLKSFACSMQTRIKVTQVVALQVNSIQLGPS
jgi:hypothetical protein